jgi:DNA-binding transcriptional regulator YhcF (GntR family)
MTLLRIDPASPTPPFEQLRTQLLAQIHDGSLGPGARLPTVRRLADDLGLAPNTVARAYRELEQIGAIETRGRHGSYVPLSSDATTNAAQEAAAAFVARLRALGIPESQARDYLDAALRT